MDLSLSLKKAKLGGDARQGRTRGSRKQGFAQKDGTAIAAEIGGLGEPPRPFCRNDRDWKRSRRARSFAGTESAVGSRKKNERQL